MITCAGVPPKSDPVTAAATAASEAATPALSANSFAAAKAAFLREHGDQYGYKGWMDKHWQREVGDRFGPGMRHYLDYTGAALFTQVGVGGVVEGGAR